MTKEEIFEELENFGYPDPKAFGRSKSLLSLKQAIIEHTSFLPEKSTTSFRLYCLENDINELPYCKECGKQHSSFKQNPNKTSKYDSYVFCDYCSRHCSRYSNEARQKGMNTTIERYGDHNMKTERGKEEYKNSMIKKYGVETPMHVPEFAEKCLKDENGEWRILSDDFKKKQKKTWDINYQDGHPMRDPIILSKIKENTLERYGVTNHTQKHISTETLEVLNDKAELEKLYDQYGYLKGVADSLGVHQSSVQRAMARLGCVIDKKYYSVGEKEVCSFLETLGIEYEEQHRFDPKDRRKSCDIFIPEHSLAIEYNGVFWHSTAVKEDKKFHQERSLRFIELGMTPFHIWEDDWNDPIKQEIIKNKIKSKLGFADRVYARKCEVGFVDSNIARVFMEENHIQGKTTASYWIGLYHGDELVACMGFKKNQEEGHFDLVRYASSKSVVGGASKLLKFFKTHVGFKKITTYAHLDYSKGDLYEKTGFKKIHVTPPGLWYVINEKRLRREKFMKHKLHDILEEFDPNLTEKQNMMNHGFFPLYDSGSIKYEFVNKEV